MGVWMVGQMGEVARTKKFKYSGGETRTYTKRPTKKGTAGVVVEDSQDQLIDNQVSG
jgi:hypothetical protein